MLTCVKAYNRALDNKETVDVNFINQFTPNIKDDSHWSAFYVNAMFCEAMYELNPFKAIGFMAEAGVPLEAIADLKRQIWWVSIKDTYMPIAPPTFNDDPLAWLKRGYSVDVEQAKAGDIIVTKDVVGFVQSFDGFFVRILHGGPDEGQVQVTRVMTRFIRGIVRV